jgi:hypothetical protein
VNNFQLRVYDLSDMERLFSIPTPHTNALYKYDLLLLVRIAFVKYYLAVQVHCDTDWILDLVQYTSVSPVCKSEMVKRRNLRDRANRLCVTVLLRT